MSGGYKNLDVWKKGMQLTNLIYDITSDFPKTEIYGLATQMRRAVVSIPSNIAEGSSRSGTSEYIYFLTIARGSLSELNTQVLIARDRKYITGDQCKLTELLLDDIGKMLNKLLQVLRSKKQNNPDSRNTNPETLIPSIL